MNHLSDAAIVPVASPSGRTRVAKYDWTKLSEELSGCGCAVIERLLSPEECRQIAGLYSQKGHFLSHINMARHDFGKGEYRYFKDPLPELLGELRTALYLRLRPAQLSKAGMTCKSGAGPTEISPMKGRS